MKPAVSFIVPVRNDARRLETSLRSIRREAGASGQLEVLVVDNGSTDGSAEIARQLGATVITVRTGRVSELRNIGARHAAADILAFVDADNEIAGGWVYAALDSLRGPQAGAVGAVYDAPVDGTWVQRTYGHLRGGAHGRHDVDWLGSGNLAVSREAFDSVGGFDISLETCEDVDFCHRLRATGRRVVSDARLKSVHHGDPRTLFELLSSERWRGRDNLRVSFRRPIAWASVPSAVMPILQTALILIALAGVIATLSAGWMGLLLAFVAVLLFTGTAWLRVVRAALRQRRTRTVGLFQSFVVACVWDIGRALALVSRPAHRAIGPRATGAAS